MDTKNSSEEWSANLAHELRSPISIIRGFAELLQDHPMEKATVQEIAGKIVHSSLRLETLIQSLLQLSDACAELVAIYFGISPLCQVMVGSLL